MRNEQSPKSSSMKLGAYGEGRSINASGQVVGSSYLPTVDQNGADRHAFLYSNGVLTDLNSLTRLARWDGLLARVVPGERGTELAGIGLTVPRHGLGPLREWMEEDRRGAGLEWREYLKPNWARIRRQSFEIAANWMESLRLSNTDG